MLNSIIHYNDLVTLHVNVMLNLLTQQTISDSVVVRLSVNGGSHDS